MMTTMLKSKIHRATLTGANLHYEGSISIDPELYEAAKMREYEQVDVLNINSGSRLTTYIISGEPGEVALTGAAARLGEVGDKVIIVAYGSYSDGELESYKPTLVFVDDNNRRN